MKIMMIGNGFDLEHDLPTRYTDFLEFIQDCQQVDNCVYGECKESNFKTFFTEKNNKYRNLIYDLTINNFWIHHFNEKLRENKRLHKGNWIDFETEIADYIKNKDNEEKYEKHKKEFCDFLTFAYINVDLDYGSMIELLLFDLQRLTIALEIYICFFVDVQEKKYYNSSILEINPEKVISFNYSHTFKKYYGTLKRNVECFYIHGEANLSKDIYIEDVNVPSLSQSNKIDLNNELDLTKICKNHGLVSKLIQRNNMVLGIDEYLKYGDENNKLDFIDFKKFFQRIYKKTGSVYKTWFDQMDLKMNELYIFGHSLDITDGDILRDFILRDNVKTTIFYKNKGQFHQQICNLIKVIGQKEVLEKVYGKSPMIVFKKQNERSLIQNSNFEIKTDMAKIEAINSYSNTEIRKIIEKFDKKIQSKSIKYFVSQENVITFFDFLQKNGLERKYVKLLLSIAHLLKDNTKDEFFDYHEWGYGDYMGMEDCDYKTKKFIDYVNHYNKTHLSKSGQVYSDIELYERYIKVKKQLTKKEYVGILNNLIEKMDDNVEFYNDLLYKISVNCYDGGSKQILKTLRNEETDIVKKIRYQNILDEIEMQEFLDSQSKNYLYDENDQYFE